MTSYRGIAWVIFISCVLSIFTAWGNGFLSHTLFSDWRDDAEYYNARALSLVHTGSLGEEQALFRRPPGYSWFLALVYFFHESIWAAWTAQIGLFCGILFLLWHISGRFLSGWHAVLPSFFLGMYWGFHVYVFSIGSEMFSVFLLLVFLFFLLRYYDIPFARYIVIAGFAAGLLALTKPVFLYAVPFFLAWLLYNIRSLKTLRHVIVCFGIVCAMVGGWAFRTYLFFGEAQTERVGHVIYTRALYGTLSWEDIRSHLIASMAGNYIADQLFPGYGLNSVPQRLGVRRMVVYNELRNQGLSPVLAEQRLLGEGISFIKSHSLKFTAGAVPALFDLNTPENFSGFPITPMFVGTREHIPAWQKITIVLFIRVVWFLVLLVCLMGCGKLLWDSSRRTVFSPLFFLILFFNGTHALIIIPAEPRFLVPVLPIYFLCFTVGITWCLTRVKKMYSVEAL
ncbi:MAG: hypothetical protein A3J54_02330 [Candidatus Ryanbacteria bacterium RIFCSPHIGHO2_02_FULL_45_13b]|uniref:Uncharacterized protein n=1 Tax=Candidatus Ryanbacteria bacterium RIFCSPHIGHO2_02_FULL_45_13b TaxID=1802117 RepID=A0A1G2GBK6_9BACT|nr:MAG: hypothetical protein A3J54_02330 [Candidatus Ryanbacteria bacterium RIFCSPHIGHO2_02_FULL_45_13b]